MSYNYYHTTILRLVAGLVIALCGAATMSLQAQEQQVITIKTKFNVGDSVYMKVVSKDAVAVQATGLSSAVLEQNWKKYALTAQTVTVTGPVKYLATFKNAELRITTNEKRQPILTINGLSVSDWCEQKWQQLIHRNRSQRL